MAVVLLALLASAAVGWAVVDVVLRLARVKGGPKASRPNVGGHQATVLEEESGPYVLRGGTWIGVLERIAITGAVLAGQPELVAAVVAAIVVSQNQDKQKKPNNPIATIAPQPDANPLQASVPMVGDIVGEAQDDGTVRFTWGEPETDWTTGDAQSPRYPTVAGHAMPDTSRVGVHPGFERVVVQYTGRASDITWRARFTGRNAAGLAGRRFLRVTVAGLRDPDEGETVPALAPAPVSGATLIKGVSVGLPRGGVQTVTVGLDADAAYRLMVLENPTRLVVDLRK